MEAADRNTQQLKGPEAATLVVTRSASETDNSKLCYRCGRSNHTSEDCRFKVCCHNCGKKGHIAKACRAKDPSKRSKRSSQQHRTKWVQVQQDEASGDLDTSLQLLRIGSQSARPINTTWMEPAIMWFVVAAKKGEKETAALRVIKRPLQTIENELQEAWRLDTTEADKPKNSTTASGG